MVQESHQLAGSDLPYARQRAPLRFTFCRQQMPVLAFELRQRPLRHRDPHRQHPADKRSFANEIKLMPEVLPAGGMVNRTRAMLKVEDGCVNFCTYCLIPYARGRVRSLPMEEAARQVRMLR